MAKKLYGGDGWSFEPAAGGGKKDVESLPDASQKATVKLEKRAKGKETTVVSGFVLSAADRGELARSLRKACGSGGSDTDAGVEIQGDHRERVQAILAARGWRVR